MSFSVNIFELTRQVFNISGYTPIVNGSNAAKIEYPNEMPTVDVVDAVATSYFGTPIFETLAFNLESELFTFEDAPLIDVTLPKHIVKSQVAGRNGTVKEYIAQGDYMVRVRGLLVNHDAEELPYDKIEVLHRIAKMDKAINVQSSFLNKLSIHNLVIAKVEYPSNERFTNVQPYVLECISDEPIELTLNV